MPIKAYLRMVRDDLLPRARFVRANPQAWISPRVSFAGEVTDAVIAPEVTISAPTVINVANGGGLLGSRLEIGRRTYIGEFNNIRCAGTRISIGADCLVSQQITIVGSNHGTAPGAPVNSQPWHGDGVEIGDDVWIGAGVVIMPGARIGSGCVIGAGSVVRGVIPAGSVAVGVPARVVKRRAVAAES